MKPTVQYSTAWRKSRYRHWSSGELRIGFCRLRTPTKQQIDCLMREYMFSTHVDTCQTWNVRKSLMRWLQTSCPMASSLNETETGELLTDRGMVSALPESPNPRWCRPGHRAGTAKPGQILGEGKSSPGFPGGSASPWAAVAAYNRSKITNRNVGLLIIDMQVCNFDESSPVYGDSDLLSKISTLLVQARAARVPIIYIQHCGPEGAIDQPDTPGW